MILFLTILLFIATSINTIIMMRHNKLIFIFFKKFYLNLPWAVAKKVFTKLLRAVFIVSKNLSLSYIRYVFFINYKFTFYVNFIKVQGRKEKFKKTALKLWQNYTKFFRWRTILDLKLYSILSTIAMLVENFWQYEKSI